MSPGATMLSRSNNLMKPHICTLSAPLCQPRPFLTSQTRGRHVCLARGDSGATKAPSRARGPKEDAVQMRAEAEAPFRSLRLVLCGFFAASAGMGFLISIPQLLGALGGAPRALPLEQVGENLAIDAAAVALFAFLFRQDWMVGGGSVGRWPVSLSLVVH
ncbi:hypothetical protein Agub_g4311 [Astrephomene gubernaculifera]|uniref:Uncharacterized protein n=1 Tax=Astrephomene gubernaculifera TaxID=47775 RepID=A0AAD3HK30_9CHLO|nr:hypothetical protein Agub_g4311 [Astrephomene gubernaculifera]